MEVAGSILPILCILSKFLMELRPAKFGVVSDRINRIYKMEIA